jgi:hypothetical protein
MAAATEENKDKLIQQSRSSAASPAKHLLYGSYCCWPVNKPVARLSRPSPVYPYVLTCVYRKAVAPSAWRWKSIHFFASNGTRTLSRLNYSLSFLRPAGAVDVVGRSAELLPLQAGQCDCKIFFKTLTGWTHRARNCGPRASSTDDDFNAV